MSGGPVALFVNKFATASRDSSLKPGGDKTGIFYLELRRINLLIHLRTV